MRAVLSVATLLLAVPAFAQKAGLPAEVLRADHEVGRRGGRLVYALRSEPKTLNPVTAIDVTSREVIGRLQADLIHVDRQTQRTGPALAKSWTVSPDGLHYRPRRGGYCRPGPDRVSIGRTSSSRCSINSESMAA